MQKHYLEREDRMARGKVVCLKQNANGISMGRSNHNDQCMLNVILIGMNTFYPWHLSITGRIVQLSVQRTKRQLSKGEKPTESQQLVVI